MRQQYHVRNVNGEALIWDVKKLVTLTQSFPVKDIPLSSVQELDEEYWFEAEGQKPPTCRNIAEHARLMQDCDLTHPIILCKDGRVMDGMHRICKALTEGHQTVKAVQFEENPEPDYKNMSLDDLPYDD